MFNWFRRTSLAQFFNIDVSSPLRAEQSGDFWVKATLGKLFFCAGVLFLLSLCDPTLQCQASDICRATIKKDITSTFNILLAEATDQEISKVPLKGEVDDAELVPKKVSPNLPLQPLVLPVLPKAQQGDEGQEEQAKLDESVNQPMAGKVDQSSLKGSQETNDDNDSPLKPQTAAVDPSGGLLKGGARIEDSELEGEDPDAQDQELQVEWDKWRNRFLQAVLSGAMDNLNNPQESDLRVDPRTQRITIQFPLGTIAWFSCKITNDRQIKNLKLDQSSGYPNYDNAVLNAVHDLAGTIILQFPRRSRRLVVSQNGGVKTSDHTEQQYFRFGDVERYRVPGN